MAIFAVIIGLLTESTVTNLYYKYYILEKHRRIQKTVVDMAAANLVIWLFIGYPVLMCIFCRKKYEQRWLEKLAKDSPNTAFNANNTTNNGTLYAKMNDNYGSDYYDKQHFDSMDMTTLNHNNHHPFANHRHHPLNIENALNGESLFDANDLPSGLRNNNLHIHRPEASLPEMFSRDYTNPTSNGRHVI
ncbi:hypothetical protein GGF43_005056 [Coemansia sp. RSA 2618]|nr:hypothetical protein GGF43_005056 [Coemansia sp. RSA 2618]